MRIRNLLSVILLTIAIAGVPGVSSAAVAISVNLSSPPPVAIAPPPIPVYVVPPPTVVGYVWMPGHWLWNGYGYFWVPGTWVQPPMVGVLWTPGYWGWGGGAFMWHEGYWGPHVGFYGGVNYGGGYVGVGFVGGRWNGGVYVADHAAFNPASGVSITASFNGGPGGTLARPTAQQLAFANEKHIPLTPMQMAHITAASRNPALAASFNHGKPGIAATPKAGDFTHGVVAATQAGARNLAAEQNNLAIKKNPALAKGAAMPRETNSRANGARQPAQGARGQPSGAGEFRRRPAEEDERHPPE